ncbi:unnamed protein product, partial [marine sediment metagenome]
MRRTEPCLLLAVLTVLALLWADGALAQAKRPIVLLFDDQERLKEKRADTNGDGRYDEFIYYVEGNPDRAEQDTNHDGNNDTTIRFGPDAKPLLQERDTNADGRTDQWIDFEAGLPKLQRDDHNFDGKADSSIEFQAGVPLRKEEDVNFD